MSKFSIFLSHVIDVFPGAPPDDVKDLREQIKNLNTELLHLEETLHQTQPPQPQSETGMVMKVIKKDHT